MFERVGRLGGPGPFEYIQLMFLLFGGITTLTHLGVPGSIGRVLPHAILVVWCILLSLGAAIGLLGCVWRGRETTALIIEQVGLIAVFGVVLIYIVTLSSQWGKTQGAAVLTFFIAGLGVQSAWRIWEIRRAQMRLRELSEFLEPEEKK